MSEARVILNAWRAARARGITCALATVVRVSGSSYRRPGAKMLVAADGEISGSVSGGCLERDLIRRALVTLSSGSRTLVRYDTSRDADDDEEEALLKSAGLGCEGMIDILIDPQPARVLETLEAVLRDRKRRTIEIALGQPEFPSRILDEAPTGATASFCEGDVFYDILAPPIPWMMFGAGHDAVAMSRMAREMGWETTVVDCRSTFPMPKRAFSGVDLFVQWNLTSGKSPSPVEPLPAAITMRPEAMAVVMTHNYEHDKAVLRALWRERFAYLGILGPRVRSERMLAELAREGFELSAELRAKMHYPMGLDIGGEGPSAIALATLAEAQAANTGRSADFLRSRTGPIH